jgi:hypothetical protein
MLYLRPLSHAGYIRTSLPLLALLLSVSTEFIKRKAQISYDGKVLVSDTGGVTSFQLYVDWLYEDKENENT